MNAPFRTPPAHLRTRQYGADRHMGEQERHHAKLDFDRAEEEGTDEAKLRWVDKWARRVVDHLWAG